MPRARMRQQALPRQDTKFITVTSFFDKFIHRNFGKHLDDNQEIFKRFCFYGKEHCTQAHHRGNMGQRIAFYGDLTHRVQIYPGWTQPRRTPCTVFILFYFDFLLREYTRDIGSVDRLYLSKF